MNAVADREQTGKGVPTTTELSAAQLWRSVFEQMGEGFFVGETVRDRRDRAIDFRFIEVNPAFETLTSTAPSAVIGRTVREVIPGIQAELIALCGEVARTGAPARFEMHIPALGGRWYEARAYRVEGDDRFGVLFLEVTRRKRVQAALHEGQTRLRLAQDATGIGIWEWDIATGATRWTRRDYQLWGRPEPPAGAGIVSADMVLASIHKEDQRRVTEAMQASIRSGEHFSSEFRITTPAGETRWIAAFGRFIAPDAAHPEGRLIGANIDKTEEFRVGAELQRLNAELAELVRAAAAVREDAQARFDRALRIEALGQLAGGIAQDINNLLEAVQAALASIEKRPEDQDDVRRLARHTLDATRRGTSVTSRLLAYTRRRETAPEILDVPTLLSELHEILSHALGVAVRLSLASEIPAVRADKGQLETALINLAVSGRDVMPKGGTLTLAALPESVALGEGPDGSAPGRCVRIAVIDNGVGMDAATLARIRDPSSTTKPAERGTGIAAARAFAEQTGGRLEIESAPGRGTVVSLLLPICPTP